MSSFCECGFTGSFLRPGTGLGEPRWYVSDPELNKPDAELPEEEPENGESATTFIELGTFSITTAGGAIKDVAALGVANGGAIKEVADALKPTAGVVKPAGVAMGRVTVIFDYDRRDITVRAVTAFQAGQNPQTFDVDFDGDLQVAAAKEFLGVVMPKLVAAYPETSVNLIIDGIKISHKQ